MPKVGVVARWTSSGGGGEDGRGGGTSDAEDVVAVLRSGIKGGGGMVLDGGGWRGGGGTTIIGGRVLSIMEGTTEAVLERRVPSSAPEETTESTDCRWSALEGTERMMPKLVVLRLESRIVEEGAEAGTAAAGAGTNWNCCTVAPTRKRAGDAGREGAGVGVGVRDNAEMSCKLKLTGEATMVSV